MTTLTEKKSVGWAMRIAQKPCEHPIRFTEQEEKDWKEARKIFLAAGLCPNCACDGMKSPLNRWQAGNYWEHAGRACPNCEQFFVCGEQPEYEPDNWMGDADPGL